MDSSGPGAARLRDSAGRAPTGGAGRGSGREGGGIRDSEQPLRAPEAGGDVCAGCPPDRSLPVPSRQPWALVGILGGDALSTAEDKREYHGNGTTGFAVAQREFLTYDGTRFTVTAFSGWIKGLVAPDRCLPSAALLGLLCWLQI